MSSNKQDDELTVADRAALAELRAAEGHHTGWARDIEIDGQPVTYTAHADPSVAGLLDEIVRAAYRHLQAHPATPPATGPRVLAETTEREQEEEEK